MIKHLVTQYASMEETDWLEMQRNKRCGIYFGPVLEWTHKPNHYHQRRQVDENIFLKVALQSPCR